MMKKIVGKSESQCVNSGKNVFISFVCANIRKARALPMDAG
jgi:archaeosine-15-forming tRNA-guanine transglycosylase